MDIEKLKSIIDESNNIVFFGGAGVSTESNIPDFRSNSGLYKTKSQFKYPPEYMLSHTFFMDHTKEFYEYYKSNMIYKEAKPNKAHLALAELERQGKLKAVITQNIDDLHGMAGSVNVLELHGSVYRNYCMKCHKFFDLDYIIDATDLPYCDSCGGIVKPDVVLYEEGLDSDTIDKALYYISNCDVFIIGGTSLRVYPAASLVDYYRGDKLILINKSETQYDKRALLSFNDSIGEVLSKVI
ncbi:MAG TPA: NAD-dependent protein deacylase [Clostridiales bacterium]|nr:NAD-dependent protein deacylase [Clostridiales bacterium]